jgi:hypothetical protein
MEDLFFLQFKVEIDTHPIKNEDLTNESKPAAKSSNKYDNY